MTAYIEYYHLLREPIRRIGGTAEYRAGDNDGGGTITLRLFGRRLTIRCDERHSTPLDSLFELPGADADATTWDDRVPHLKPDWFRRLMRLQWEEDEE